MGKGLGIGIDWLTGTMALEHRGDVHSWLKDFGIDLPERGKGRLGYESGFHGELKSFLAWSDGMGGAAKRSECCLSLNGSTLAPLDGEAYLELVGALKRFGFENSRLDIRCDDCENRVSMEEVGRIARCGDFVGLRSYQTWEKGKSASNGGYTVDFGKIGSAGCGKMLAVYDKTKESKGLIDAIRFEARFFGERAANIFQAFTVCGSVSSLLGLCGRLIAGVVDFRVGAGAARGAGNQGKCPRYPWWQSICDDLGGAEISVVTPAVRSLDDILAWIKQSVARNLALVLEAADRGAFGGIGSGLLLDQLRDLGTLSFDERDRRLLDAVVREFPF